MPAAAFCFCMLARFGPLFAGVEVVLIPAFALAADQSDPKASPPDADGFVVGFEKELVGVAESLPPIVDDGREAGVGTWTDVK